MTAFECDVIVNVLLYGISEIDERRVRFNLHPAGIRGNGGKGNG